MMRSTGLSWNDNSTRLRQISSDWHQYDAYISLCAGMYAGINPHPTSTYAGMIRHPTEAQNAELKPSSLSWQVQHSQLETENNVLLLTFLFRMLLACIACTCESMTKSPYLRFTSVDWKAHRRNRRHQEECCKLR